VLDASSQAVGTLGKRIVWQVSSDYYMPGPVRGTFKARPSPSHQVVVFA
jgi:hypothetical protein